jgi:segregation and condensation protein A
MENHYQIKTEKFEGPLHLLLDMIEKRKLLINDFSLSQIADDFIGHVSSSTEKSLSKISDFLLIASTLILIKSRSLLPTLSLEKGEESDIKNLEIRLNILKIIKDIIPYIEQTFQKNILFPKKQIKALKPKFTPSEKINLHSMRIVMLDVINTLPKFEEKKEARIRRVVSLEDTMNKLVNRIKKNFSMSFFEFSGKKNTEKTDKINVIVSFLAVLELVKRGLLSATQNNNYKDISLESNEVNTPTFGL